MTSINVPRILNDDVGNFTNYEIRMYTALSKYIIKERETDLAIAC